MKLRHLRPKELIEYKDPSDTVLDTFPNPGIDEVTLNCTEFTSLCPITGQPDFGVIKITYAPRKLCLESKSLKLYLGMYRQYGGFAEKITQRIYEDLNYVLVPKSLKVIAIFTSRGGISIEASKGDPI